MSKPPKVSELGLKTNHVFLDTDVYRRYGHNLDDKVLQTLLRLTTDHVCTLHITDITKAEIRRQLGEMAAEVATAANKSNKQLRHWRAVRSLTKPVPKTPDDVSAANLAQEAVQQFNYAMTIGWKPTEHKAMAVPADRIFRSYFRREPPFDKADSKEFPDAFIIAALDQWCEQNKAKMYVITRDKAMIRAVEMTDTLLPLHTLEDFLALFINDPKVLAKVDGILKAQWSTVEEGVRDQIGNLGTVYTGDLDDGEVVEHEVADGQMQLAYCDVISVSDEQIVVVAKVEVPVTYEVQYLDTNTGWWDSEDKEFVGSDKAVQTIEMETTLSLLIAIEPKEGEITEVDILTRDVHIQEAYEDYK